VRIALIRAAPMTLLGLCFALLGEWHAAMAWGCATLLSLSTSHRERITGQRQYTIAIRHALEVARAEARKHPPSEAQAILGAALVIAKLADSPPRP